MDIVIEVDAEATEALRETMIAAAEPILIDECAFEDVLMQAPPSLPPPLATLARDEPRPLRRPARWPLVLCGTVVITSAMFALLTSPLATGPTMAPLASLVLANLD
jgi:hypothetical protein